MPHIFLRGKYLGQVDAILFDKDGTLSHSEPMLASLARSRIEHCLSLAGLKDRDPSAHQLLNSLLQQAYGLTEQGVNPAGAIAVASHAQNLISTATVLAQVGFGWPDALTIAEKAFASASIESQDQGGTPPLPKPTQGITHLLNQLTSTGFQCAVISNDDTEGIKQFIHRNGLSDHFQALWSAEHCPSKPNPDAVHGLCHELSVAPSRCALIGDADSDLRMGRSAGVPVVLGYIGGWSLPVELDPSFHQFRHWQEVQVRV